jgi:hypothetical protein
MAVNGRACMAPEKHSRSQQKIGGRRNHVRCFRSPKVRVLIVYFYAFSWLGDDALLQFGPVTQVILQTPPGQDIDC